MNCIRCGLKISKDVPFCYNCLQKELKRENNSDLYKKNLSFYVKYYERV